MKKKISFEYELLPSIDHLSEADKTLFLKARKVTEKAYAPYSKFHVGAAALLVNGEIVEGSNQENASYPAGICAERTLMSNASMQFPNVGIGTLAISYHNMNPGTHSDKPISPCGICRQSLLEFQGRTKQAMKVILGGMEGEVLVIYNAAQLLPFSFTSDDMK